MPTMIHSGLTDFGRALMAKGIAGAGIHFTGIQLGKGYLPADQGLAGLTHVVDWVATLDITHCTPSIDGMVTVGGFFSNAQLDMGFYYRELALLAEDADLGSGVYCYGNAGDLAEWIPPTGDMAVVEKTIDVITVVGAAASVTANIPLGIYAKREEFTAHNTDTTAHPPIWAQFTANDTRMAHIETELQVLKDSTLNNMTNNVFLKQFDSLASVALARGVYNPASREIYV